MSGQECDCHKWYDTSEIGDWLHYLATADRLRTVREHAADPHLWEKHKPGFDRETMTRLISDAGGIRHEFAPEACIKGDGPVMLSNGIHRWERSSALCVPRIPVSVTWSPEETPMIDEWGSTAGFGRSPG